MYKETTLRNKNQILDQFESKLDWFYDRCLLHSRQYKDPEVIYKIAYRDYYNRYGESIEYTLAALENA